ncbi:hypothetical protein [Streptomyces nanshensis]|uniref:Lipoprotein n=1 Tax=Streptomyces nanshensis TaxID=518642 RepID=A0A1E7L8D9_9ACTN|nr:hypothetical protein [Streptomyces nanshensis]OEV12243.1 hypothetical protein AN218_09260 [Streptomyces nanshensis]
MGHRPEAAAQEAVGAWRGGATNRLQWLLAPLGAGCAALGAVLGTHASWNLDSAPLVMAVVGCFAAGLLGLFGTLAFVHVRVTIDSTALDVRCGHAGVPRRRIPLGEVRSAEVVRDVTPRHWGGWGYRWRPGRGTALVVRRGEGVLLRLADGQRFTVTVDGAEAAVRAIRRHLERDAPLD